jgi:hypothetical protein
MADGLTLCNAVQDRMEVAHAGVEHDPNAWGHASPAPDASGSMHPDAGADAADSKAATLSKFRGVEWDKYVKKWRSRITIKGKKLSLGSYVSEEDAARYGAGTWD